MTVKIKRKDVEILKAFLQQWSSYWMITAFELKLRGGSQLIQSAPSCLRYILDVCHAKTYTFGDPIFAQISKI